MIRLDPVKIDLEGTTLIEASAGTGKTFTIATLYLRLLLESELSVGEILVMTYTRAATAELRNRIRGRIVDALSALETDRLEADVVLQSLFSRAHEESDRLTAVRRLSAALADFDEAAILTIHGFCQRVLRENAFESRAGFDLELLVDQEALVLEIVGDYWARTIAGEPEAFIRYLASVGTNIRSLVRLAQRAIAAEALPLIPAPRPIDREQFVLLEAEWKRALNEVRGSWKECASEVVSLIHLAAKGKVLKNTSYKPPQIVERYEREMDQLLAQFWPASSRRSKTFERFTPAKLRRETSKGNKTPEHPFFGACGDLQRADEALCDSLDVRSIEFERGMIEAVEVEGRIRKEQMGQQSYDDLLRQVASALEGDGGRVLSNRLRNQYRATLVDEFQDTDRLQYRILRSIWHGDSAPRDAACDSSALFLIGDPKQAIYAFRGADVYAYLMAKSDAGDRCFTIGTNWRSDPSMVRAINTLFAQSESPFGLEGIPFDPVAPSPDARDKLAGPEIAGSEIKEELSAALEILFVSSADAKLLGRATEVALLSQRVAAQIAALLQGGTTIAGAAVRPNDIAVLCRTNRQTDVMCRELRAIGIPAALLGSASVFETEEAREMGYVLAAIAAPESVSRLRAALATRIFGQSGNALAEIYELRNVDAIREQPEWELWLLRFRRWHTIWLERGFIQMFHQLMREARVHSRLLALEDGERRLTNFLQLAELLEQAVQNGQLGQRGLIEWHARARLDRSFRDNVVGEEGELRLESDSDAVKVVTLHKSKGLEYPIVYCPYLWIGASLRPDDKKWVRFHDVERASEIVLDLGSDAKQEHQALALEETVSEATRLLYVALTRAKHRCCVVWGNFRGADASPLARLLHPSLGGAGGKNGSSPVSLAGMDDDEMRRELGQLFRASQGAIGLRELDAQPALRAAPKRAQRELLPKPVTRELSTSWRHSSFSALSASDPRDLSRMREEGLDHDAVSVSPTLGLRSGVEEEVMLNGFPAGAAAGTMLHSILEHLDFEVPALEQSRDIVRETLDLHGFDPSWHGLLCRALDRITQTRWSEDGPCLANLPLSRRLDEFEFLLPVAAQGNDGHRVQGLCVADLARVFESHASGDFQKRYAKRLTDLRFEPLAGYLKGFIDLVFEWKGRFYLVDYKSNHLGPTPSNYDVTGLEASMSEHHYVLQYHLYTVALDRYLAQRFEGYDYDRHFGGVYYLFLRGMDPGNREGSGIYHDRPTRACIEALSESLRQPSGATP